MSLEAKQIHPAVQKALYRKIDGLDKLFIGTTKPISAVSTALDVGNNLNPIEQQMVRACWARVTAAVKDPDKKGLDGLSDQPVYFSSYIEDSSKGRVIENANRPLTYNNRSTGLIFGENKNNIFRGETGITQVSVEQLSFFVKKMTISFSCPDPIDFEKRIQPIFLRHGQYCAVEFGWGMNDVDIKTPPLSLDDIQKLNSSVKERNLALAGNYQCDVGIVSNYTFSLNTDGGYEGTIDILSRGQNVLNQTSQHDNDLAKDVLSVQTSIQNLRDLDEIKKELTEEDLKNLTDAEKAAVLGSTNELDDIQRAKITYKQTMLGLDSIIDSYLNDVETESKDLNSVKKLYPGLRKAKTLGFVDENKMGSIVYKFKDGVLRTRRDSGIIQEDTETLERLKVSKTVRENLTDLAQNKYWMSWGWFEDHILNSFFSIDINITKGGVTNEKQTLQSIRSVTDDDGIIKPNRCHVSKDLYTKGLDSVILPRRTHHNAFNRDTAFELKDLEVAELTFTGLSGRTLTDTDAFRRHQKLAGVHLIFKIINEKFKPFIPEGTRDLEIENFGYQDNDMIVNAAAQGGVNYSGGNLDKSQFTYEDTNFGSIRNMVFPIGKFKEHFTNMETLKQGLRSFWSDVQNQYGGYWAFGIGQDDNNTGRIGVYDLYYNSGAEKVDLFVSDNQSTREDFVNYEYKKYTNPKTGQKSMDKTDKIFTFPLYSKDSFVKDFSLNVKMSSKAATIAVYGGNTNVATGTQRSGDINDLSLTAYSLLLNPTKKEKTKSETLSEIKQSLQDGLVSEMSFPVDDDMIGTGISSYSRSNRTDGPYAATFDSLFEVPLNDEGIDFHDKNIKFKDEVTEILSKLENLDEVTNSRAYYDWYNFDVDSQTRFYDVTGNMKSSYVRTMLFLINASLFEGDESNIQITKPVIPIDIDMTIDGVGGLKPFDLFRVDYLPEIYRNYTYFQIFDVGHTITPGGWETKITAKMKLDLPKYLKDYPGTLKDKVIKELFFDFRNEQQRKDDDKDIETLQRKIDRAQNKINQLRPKLDIQSAWKAAKEKEDFDGTFKLAGEKGSIVLYDRAPIMIEYLPSGKYRIIKVQGNPKYKFKPGEKGGYSVGRWMTIDERTTLPIKYPKSYFSKDYAGKIDTRELQIQDYKNQIQKINQRGRAPISQNQTNNGNNQKTY